jgi:hypothetical protein
VFVLNKPLQPRLMLFVSKPRAYPRGEQYGTSPLANISIGRRFVFDKHSSLFSFSISNEIKRSTTLSSSVNNFFFFITDAGTK